MSVDIEHKCLRVIASCNTTEQLKVGAKYYLLAKAAVNAPIGGPFQYTAVALLWLRRIDILSKLQGEAHEPTN